MEHGESRVLCSVKIVLRLESSSVSQLGRPNPIAGILGSIDQFAGNDRRFPHQDLPSLVVKNKSFNCTTRRVRIIEESNRRLA